MATSTENAAGGRFDLLLHLLCYSSLLNTILYAVRRVCGTSGFTCWKRRPARQRTTLAQYLLGGRKIKLENCKNPTIHVECVQFGRRGRAELPVSPPEPGPDQGEDRGVRAGAGVHRHHGQALLAGQQSQIQSCDTIQVTVLISFTLCIDRNLYSLYCSDIECHSHSEILRPPEWIE